LTIKIGVIGAGKIVRVRHLPEIQMNPDAEVGAVCDIVEARAQKMAQEYGCEAYTDYHAMLNDKSLDAIVVAATNTTHAEMTIAALQAGKHVLCEKPMATTLDGAREMITAAKMANRQLMIGHNQRLEPAHQKAKEIIQSGKIGKVLTFKSVFGHPGPEYWAIDGVKTWFYKKEITRFGVLGDLAIHKIDLLRWLLDDDFTEASAMINTLSKTYPDGNLIDVEDNAACLLRTRKGVLGSVITSWSYQKEDNSTTIYGGKGVLQIYVDPDFPIIVHYDHERAEFHKTGKQSTNVEQVKSGVMDAFVDALINKTPVPIPGIEGYKALEAVIACLESAESGKVVQIL